jgi:hypothetical protein
MYEHIDCLLVSLVLMQSQKFSQCLHPVLTTGRGQYKLPWLGRP